MKGGKYYGPGFAYEHFGEKIFFNIGKDKKMVKGTKMGNDNPAKRPEVREKISNTVKSKWEAGAYKDRINGMLGILGEMSPQFKPEIHTLTYFAEHEYKEFLSIFQPVDKCSRCHVTEPDRIINVHHIDENHKNFLPSNLDPLCVPCHMSYHYELQKGPFVSIIKEFTFASAHHLPNYNGKCANLHGHEWKLEIDIRKRVDKKTGMVMDFSTLKEIVNKSVIDVFDHHLLNEFIQMPTAENLLVRIWDMLMFGPFLKGINSIKLWESKDSFAKIDVNGMLAIFTENIEDYLLT